MLCCLCAVSTRFPLSLSSLSELNLVLKLPIGWTLLEARQKVSLQPEGLVIAIFKHAMSPLLTDCLLLQAVVPMILEVSSKEVVRSKLLREECNFFKAVLKEFVKGWIVLFSRSPKSRLGWRTQTQLTSPSYSATRWRSWFEVVQQIHDCFGDIQLFLQRDYLPPASKLEACTDPLWS